MPGQSSAQVAGNVLVALANDPVRPTIVNYMSDPASSWNRIGGAARPSEGTTPTGGTAPSASTSGDRFTADVMIGGTSLSFHVVSTTYGRSPGNRFAATVNCSLSGDQWIDSKGTTKTLVGNASGSFDISLKP